MICANCNSRHIISRHRQYLCMACGHRMAKGKTQSERVAGAAATRGQSGGRKPSMPRVKFLEQADD